MKKTYLYLIIVILVLILVGILTYERTDTIIFKDSDINGIVHDFGKITKNDSTILSFRLKYVNNLYPKIKVYGANDACDCTESVVEEGNYHLGDTITLNVKYNPNKYNDLGLIEKKVFLITNETISTYDSLYPFTIRGNIH